MKPLAPWLATMGGKKLPSKKDKEAGAKAVKGDKAAKQAEDAEWKVRRGCVSLGVACTYS